MQLISMRRSTVLADAFRARSVSAMARVGFSCLSHDSNEIAQTIRQKLKNYMNGFMNDPSRTDGLGRASWPGRSGEPVEAWDSPLAHRKFFEWRAGGADCISEEPMKAMLYDIGMELTICSKSVAAALIHTMDKGGDDNCTYWPEYLNSMFAMGPVSDSGAPDPTEPGGPSSDAPTSTEPAAPVDKYAGFTMKGGAGPAIDVKTAPTLLYQGPGTKKVPSLKAKASAVEASSSKTLLIGAGIAAAIVAAVVWLR